jgi:hypothetical protein
VKQIVSQCSSALAGLFEIVPKAMCRDWHCHGLDIFGKKHLASVHQRPSL